MFKRFLNLFKTAKQEKIGGFPGGALPKEFLDNPKVYFEHNTFNFRSSVML